LLHKAEGLAGTKFPAEVVEVTLEPKLNTLCIRFRKPSDGELGEPAHPQVHLFKDSATNEVTAVELLEIDKFA
jgi:hypothetical protein